MPRVTFRVHALMALAFVAAGTGVASRASTRESRSRCVVPSVKGDKLGAARERLHAAHCSAGPISGPRNGLVNGQRPKPGRHGRTGAKVALTLKRKSTASNPPATQTGGRSLSGSLGNWKLVLDSEFDGNSLDTSVWRAGWFGTGVTSPMTGTQEDCYSPNNVTFPGDGTMHLNVTGEPSTCGGVTEPYTGALVNTDPADGGGFEYTYGVLEARVYVPADGTLIADWPGIWTDGQTWPTDGEDDVTGGPQRRCLRHLPWPAG